MAGYVRSKSAVTGRGSVPDLRRVVDLTTSHEQQTSTPADHQSPVTTGALNVTPATTGGFNVTPGTTGGLNVTAREPATCEVERQSDERPTGHNGLVSRQREHVQSGTRSTSSVNKLDDVFKMTDHVPV